MAADPDNVENINRIVYNNNNSKEAGREAQGTSLRAQVTRGPLFMFVGHEEYLVTVDLTSHVGTIPTWLASYFLV